LRYQYKKGIPFRNAFFCFNSILLRSSYNLSRELKNDYLFLVELLNKADYEKENKLLGNRLYCFFLAITGCKGR